MPDGIPNEFYIWLASQPGYEGISPEKARELFQGWEQPQQETVYSRYLEALKPPEPRPLPLGRPQPEKYGITEQDWQVLMMLSGNPAKVQRELEKWISTGMINQFQARDIWGELDVRVRQATAQFLFGEDPEDRERRLAREAREEKEEEWARTQREIAELGGMGPAAWERAGERRQRERWERGMVGLDYGVGLEEMRAGFAVPQTERWRDWFRSKYPRLIEQFKAQEFKDISVSPTKTWTEYLEKRKPEIREQWYGMTPYERGERPSVFAPRIQTVGF